MNLVNQTIRNTKFPTVMKLSEISPIFKTSDTLATGIYRQINILPRLSKIFEKLYHEQLYEFFSSILSAFLAAFRSYYGCHHVLTKFVHDCKVPIDKGLTSVLSWWIYLKHLIAYHTAYCLRNWNIMGWLIRPVYYQNHLFLIGSNGLKLGSPAALGPC